MYRAKVRMVRRLPCISLTFHSTVPEPATVVVELIPWTVVTGGGLISSRKSERTGVMEIEAPVSKTNGWVLI